MAASWEQLRLPAMPPRRQRAIADFLDRETERIDRLVEKKRRLIELLEEKRTALISHAVTKGLDPTVPMKDSGVPWVGDDPGSLGRSAHDVRPDTGSSRQDALQGAPRQVPTTTRTSQPQCPMGPVRLIGRGHDDRSIAWNDTSTGSVATIFCV